MSDTTSQATTDTVQPGDQSAATATAQQTQATQGDPADLGDAGKKALDAERTARRAAEKAATDLQTKLDAINRANETALEKAQREASEAQAAIAQATAETLRLKVAIAHGISSEDAELFLTGTDEQTLQKQAARLAEKASTTSTGPRPDLTQGPQRAAASGAGTPEQDFAHFLGAQMGA
jgi:hypothetical protein